MAPKPVFFIIRPGLERITPAGELLTEPGRLVPLIPLDHLPEWLEVVGVPRELTPRQASAMENLGPLHAEGETYQLRFRAVGDERPKDGRIATASPVGGEKTTPRAAQGLASSRHNPDNGRHALDPRHNPDNYHEMPGPDESSPPRPSSWKPSRHIPDIKNSSSSSSRHALDPRHNPDCYHEMMPDTNKMPSPAPPAAVAGPRAASPFCRHWCHHGTCKWGTHCRYQHAMPATATGLADIGLKDLPAWYRAALGLPPDLLRSRRAARKKKPKKASSPITPPPLLGGHDSAPVSPRDNNDGHGDDSGPSDDADDERESPPAAAPQESLIDL